MHKKYVSWIFVIFYEFYFINATTSVINDCKNGGTKIEDEYCFCPVGYHGLQCEFEICQPPFQNIDDKCECFPGFNGNFCREIEFCWNGFSFSLLKTGFCDCNAHPINKNMGKVFTGALCQLFNFIHELWFCLPGTKNFNFETLETTCECRPPYTGKYCNSIGTCYNGGTPLHDYMLSHSNLGLKGT